MDASLLESAARNHRQSILCNIRMCIQRLWWSNIFHVTLTYLSLDIPVDKNFMQCLILYAGSKYGYCRFHSDPVFLHYMYYNTVHLCSCRAVEESLAESKQTANMMGFTSMSYFTDPLNPHERRRQGDLPVGLKNVGNSCWFNVAIQVLYCT